MQSAAYRSHAFITPWYFHTRAARCHGGWWEFALPDWCRVRSVIPAWFTELWTMTVVLRAAWNATPCLSLIHSALQRGRCRRRRRTCTGARVTARAQGGDSLKNSKGGKETEWAIICCAKDSGADVAEAQWICGSSRWYVFCEVQKCWNAGATCGHSFIFCAHNVNAIITWFAERAAHHTISDSHCPASQTHSETEGWKGQRVQGRNPTVMIFYAYRYFTYQRLNSLWNEMGKQVQTSPIRLEQV